MCVSVCPGVGWHLPWGSKHPPWCKPGDVFCTLDKTYIVGVSAGQWGQWVMGSAEAGASDILTPPCPSSFFTAGEAGVVVVVGVVEGCEWGLPQAASYLITATHRAQEQQ